MTKISVIKSLRQFCATNQLDADLVDCKQFVDLYYKEPFVERLKEEIMLCGQSVDASVLEPVFALQKTIPDQVYLTGSRFFGGVTRNSDWDFFVQENLLVTDNLRNQGFYKVSDQWSYLDVDCASVWQNGNVHIQLSKDVNRRLMARNQLKAATDSFNGLSKRQRSQVWNKLL